MEMRPQNALSSSVKGESDIYSGSSLVSLRRCNSAKTCEVHALVLSATRISFVDVLCCYLQNHLRVNTFQIF